MILCHINTTKSDLEITVGELLNVALQVSFVV